MQTSRGALVGPHRAMGARSHRLASPTPQSARAGSLVPGTASTGPVRL
jgi:hypothetical protein